MDAIESNIHQVLVKLLDGTHRFLNFDSPSPSVSAVKSRIETLTSIPSDLQLLVLDNSRILRDQQILQIAQPHESPPPPFLETLARDSSIQLNPNQGANRLGKFPVIVHLLLRLKGGKGGFGSLLRGAATKAGQKKTNNFDACRDMNGRRLRHVNAEKKLEEWRAEAEERELEKMAEEYIKKKGKEMAKKGKSNGGDSADKYVAKYREDSAKCMEEIERSVRESIQGLGSSKRKNLAEGSESASKKLKIRWGKRKMGDSDSEDLDEEGSDTEGEEENEKSVVIDNGSNSDSSKESETRPGSITDKKLVAESDDQGSSEGGSEDVDNVAEEPLKSDKSTNSCSEDENGQSKDNQPLCHGSHSSKVDEMGGQQPGISAGEEAAHSAKVENSISEPVHKEPISMSSDHQISEKPLNFDEYHSAAELEVFGMERLKSELQSWGLKCGGTLQERAARLFLLKTTPLEMLPKKLFAKK